MAGIGRTKNSSSIQTMVIRKRSLRSRRRFPAGFCPTSFPAWTIVGLEDVQSCRDAGDAGSNQCSDAPRFDGVQ